MSASFKKLWNNYGIGSIVIFIIFLYVLSMLYRYFVNKGRAGSEGNVGFPSSSGRVTKNIAFQNNNQGAVQPSNPLGQNEVFASVQGGNATGQGIPSACNKPNIQNPADLLPQDKNSQWAQLNPAGKGDLANINLLKAGYHIGIDTIGQTLRNANLQIRSEPPNPQINTGPWNLSTIEPDFMRPPLELGQGGQ